jgi:sulfate adenylyltransferase subunit 2
VGSVQESIDKGRVREETGANASRNALQTVTLLDTIGNIKSMPQWVAQEGMKRKRVPRKGFSPIGTNLGNGIQKTNARNYGTSSMGKSNMGEHFRVFPISNWTEMDVWQYILNQNIKLPSYTLPIKGNAWLETG